MKLDPYTKSLLLLLFCCGIYASYYSVKLVWIPNDLNSINDGFQMRGEPQVATDVTQIMITTTSESLGGTVALMHSIVKNSKKPVYFFIATDNITMNHLWKWIEESKLSSVSYEIKGITLEWIQSRVNLTGSLQELLMYSRLFFYEIFPNMKRQIVILDDDIIVQGDISQLGEIKLKDSQIGAFSQDCDTISKRFNYKGKKYGNKMYTFKEPLKSLKLNANTCIFNLGVSVIDVQEWINNDVTGQVLNLMSTHKKDKIFKEDGPLCPMLVVLYNRTLTIDPLWHIKNIGISSGSRYDTQFLAKAKLLHWNGNFKPWRRNSPYSEIFDRYFVPDPTGIFKIHRKIDSVDA